MLLLQFFAPPLSLSFDQDGTIIPEDFTTDLQRELRSSDQPCLVPFLKKSLPHLRHSLALGELEIEGVNPPPRAPSTLQIQQTQSNLPQLQVNIQVSLESKHLTNFVSCVACSFKCHLARGSPLDSSLQ